MIQRISWNGFMEVHRERRRREIVYVLWIHQTLTWTTEPLTCVRDHSYACVYSWGLDTPTVNQHNTFDSEKLTSFSCAHWRGVRTSGPTLYQLSHPVNPFNSTHNCGAVVKFVVFSSPCQRQWIPVYGDQRLHTHSFTQRTSESEF